VYGRVEVEESSLLLLLALLILYGHVEGEESRVLMKAYRDHCRGESAKEN